ncbi:MAG: AMP-dependent synthetase/ligase [Bacteroidales bacterium]|nr:AMP-dependent synthetase/ligase [Bacteroidales bacterium]
MEKTVTRLFDLLARAEARYSWKKTFIAGKGNGTWQGYSVGEYIEMSNAISYGLIHLGVKPGEKIATISNNRPEWNFLDMAIMQIGAIHIPIYATLSQDDYKYILNHAEVTYLFVSNQELFKKMDLIREDISTIKDIYSIEKNGSAPCLEDLVEKGKVTPQEKTLTKSKEAINTKDVATIIYTSGTTGKPKGVMLTHSNIISNFVEASKIPPIGAEGKALSYLPLCHIYERMLNYVYQYLGISIYYAESIAAISDNMKEVQPHIMTTVPRLLEKIYDRIIAKGRSLKGLKKQIFFWAIHLGHRYDLKRNNLFYNIQLRIASKLIFSKWREAVGNHIKVMVSGGAALQPRLSRIFWAAGIPVLEGYGLTESSPVIAVNCFHDNGTHFGTVGPVLKGTEVKIANDGEILAKGPNVMAGYYKDEALTKKVINEEGWLHTGDMGEFVENRFLRITGRKKEQFKTSFGKYIAPTLIENKLKESPFIDNALVCGENQKFAAALIVPNFIHIRNWCAIKEIHYSTDNEMIQNPIVVNRILREVHEKNKSLGATEQVKKIELIDHEWSQESGELTPKLSLKRDVVMQKYQVLIERLFA